MSGPPLVSASSRLALDAFLADNQGLERLTARLSAFNLFNVLQDAEIRHGNLLAWLPHPAKPTG